MLNLNILLRWTLALGEGGKPICQVSRQVEDVKAGEFNLAGRYTKVKKQKKTIKGQNTWKTGISKGRFQQSPKTLSKQEYQRL